MMLAENDLVALRTDQPEHRLRAGDTGTVVSTHPAIQSYTVEFMTSGGETLALLTLPESETRPVADDEIAPACPSAVAA